MVIDCQKMLYKNEYQKLKACFRLQKFHKTNKINFRHNNMKLH